MAAVVNAAAATIIARLGLEPLPHEGGFFRRTWTSPARLPNGRAAGGTIYFLATETGFSGLHRLQTDEVWCFHAGDPVEHVQLVSSQAPPCRTLLGADMAAGQALHVVVPGGVWQGARLAGSPLCGWALMTCCMAPAWDEREFTLGDRAALLGEFPGAAEWIRALTR